MSIYDTKKRSAPTHTSSQERPPQINAIHIGPGQEVQLKHELGHVVQQKQGLTQPTGEINGQPLNDDEMLEKDADQVSKSVSDQVINSSPNCVIQRFPIFDIHNLSFGTSTGGSIGSIYFANGRIRLVHEDGPICKTHAAVDRFVASTAQADAFEDWLWDRTIELIQAEPAQDGEYAALDPEDQEERVSQLRDTDFVSHKEKINQLTTLGCVAIDNFAQAQMATADHNLFEIVDSFPHLSRGVQTMINGLTQEYIDGLEAEIQASADAHETANEANARILGYINSIEELRHALIY